MRDRELPPRMTDIFPAYKLAYAIGYLQGLSAQMPNETTEAAMREAEAFRQHPENYTRFATFAAAMKAMDAEDEEDDTDA